MKRYSVLLAVIALVISSLACQTVMGGGDNGFESPADDSGIPTIPPIVTDGGNVTVGGDSPFPVAGDPINLVSTSDTVTYQTNLSSDDVVKFYQDEFGKTGYTEDASMAVNFNGVFTMGFDGHESGRKIILAGAPVGDGTTSVTITLQ